MSNAQPDPTAQTIGATPRRPVGPPSKHQLALMIWIAVFPTLTVLNLALKPWLNTMGPVLRTSSSPRSPFPSSSTDSCRGCTGSAPGSSPRSSHDRRPPHLRCRSSDAARTVLTRLNLLRAGYLFIGAGLATVNWPLPEFVCRVVGALRRSRHDERC